MKDIKLSICIATYNRANFIGETLESIVRQINDDTEIVIVDGASPDRTEEVVKHYQSICSQLNYHRLPKKGGVDQDYCKAVEFAAGEYCWLFTDDDMMKQGAIATILSLINNHKQYSMIVVNAALYSSDLTRRYKDKILNILTDQEYTAIRGDQDKFFQDTANYLSFIGCLIIRRRLWNERNKEKYFGTEFIHVGVIFQEPMPENILVIAEPYISIRLNNSQWRNRALKMWLISWPQLIWSFTQYSENIRRCVCPKYPSMQLRKLLYYRAMASYSVKEYFEYIKPYSNRSWSRLPARIIASLPGVFTNIFLILYATIRQRIWMLIELKSSKFYYWH